MKEKLEESNEGKMRNDNKQEGPRDVCFCKDNAHVGDFRHMSKHSKITK